MKPRGSLLDYKVFSSPYPESNQSNCFIMITLPLRSVLIFSSHLYLSLPKGLFPVELHAKYLKSLMSSPILVTCRAHPILKLSLLSGF